MKLQPEEQTLAVDSTPWGDQQVVGMFPFAAGLFLRVGAHQTCEELRKGSQPPLMAAASAVAAMAAVVVATLAVKVC